MAVELLGIGATVEKINDRFGSKAVSMPSNAMGLTFPTYENSLTPSAPRVGTG